VGAYGSPDLSQAQQIKEKPKKKPFYKRWWFVLIFVMLVFFLIGTFSSEEDALKAAEDSSEPDISTEKKPANDVTEFFKVGDSVETKAIRAIVTDIEKPLGDQFNTPTEGNEFVLINLILENIFNADISISSMLSFNAYVDDIALNQSFLAQISKEGTNTVDGTIAPGKKIIGTLSYEVPKNWKHIEIHFKPNIYENTAIKWIIDNK